MSMEKEEGKEESLNKDDTIFFPTMDITKLLVIFHLNKFYDDFAV
jgi:hypothetical protein